MRVFAKDIRNFRLHASLLFNTQHRYSSIFFGSARPALPCGSGFKTSQLLCRSRVFSSKADNSNISKYNIDNPRKPFESSGALSTQLGPTPIQVGSNVLPVALINIEDSDNTAVKILLIPIKMSRGDTTSVMNTISSLSAIRTNLGVLESLNDAMTGTSHISTKNTERSLLDKFDHAYRNTTDDTPKTIALYDNLDQAIYGGEPYVREVIAAHGNVEDLEHGLEQTIDVSFGMNLTSIRETLNINLKKQRWETLMGNLLPVATESYLAKEGDDEPCKEKPKPMPMPCRKVDPPCAKKEIKKEEPSRTVCKYKKKPPPCKKENPCKEDPCDDPCKKAQQTPATIQEPAQATVQEPGMPGNAMLLAKKKNGDCKKDDKKKKDPCKKKDDKKKDPCKKKDDKKKKDSCKKKDDKKKKDPCKKKDDKKKKDPCKKDDTKKLEEACKKLKEEKAREKKKLEEACKKLEQEKGCKKDKKKDDPCKKKKDDPCKKKKDDPCKKKKDDPCKKKKDDPCKKKKDDPCKKKKDDPCKKKKDDPCKKKDNKKGDKCKKDDKKKGDSCKKDDKKKLEEDCKKLKQEKAREKKKLEEACKKLEQEKGCKKKDKKKDDPCKKKKDDPCKKKKDDPCKNKKDDPCNKKKDDPCKKKKDDPCKKKKDDPCKKKDNKKGDKCKKKDDKKKGDSCKKDDKKKLEEACKKLEQEKAREKKKLEEACKKLEDKKKGDPCKKNPKKKCDANQSETKGETSSSDYFGTKSTRPNMGVSFSMSRHIREPSNDIQLLASASGKTEVAMARKTRLNSAKTPRFPLDLLSISKRKYSTHNPDEDDTDKCKDPSIPKNRKDIKKRTSPQWTCPGRRGSDEDCRKRMRITKGDCPDDEENKNSSTGKLSAWYGIPYRWVCPAPNTTRPLSTSASNKSKNSKSECDEEPFNIDDICQNEVLQITDAYKIEKCYEPIPRFSDYDVVLRNHAVAISGSDIHVYETGGEGCPGMTMGHDAACEVVKVGRCIHTLKPGDRVAVESGLSCGICTFCKHGSYNMCSQLLYNGFLSKYQVHPADLCHKLPPSISYEEGALTHSLALGCQACFKARITPVSNVLIIGSCITAVSAALCARAFGAKKVCMTCSMKPLLQWINKCFGFDYVPFEVTYELNETLENVYCSFMDWPDIAINCSISETSMNLAVMALQPCGTCVLAECDTECACFNAMDILMKNLKLLPSFRSTNMFPTAIHLMKSGKAPMQRLISECYSWNQVDRAFQEAQHEANVGNRKVIIRCSEEENIEQCSDA